MSIVLAHPELAIWGGIAILCVLTAAAYLRLTGEEGTHHKTPRPQARTWAGAARAGRRVLGAPGRLPVTAHITRAARRAAAVRRLPAAARAWWAFHRPRRDPSTEEREAMALWHQMRLEDTGGLLALPAAGTTVKIEPGDTRAAGRTLTVQAGPALYGAAVAHAPAAVPATTSPVAGPLPDLPPDELDASCTYQDRPPFMDSLSDETIARGMTAVT